ncbi:MAG TPA: hypothetical protein VEJ42_06645 [Streptosporangiaceae bacterium]|nr:hypothetical protein [Streptosporangiaceae bacterium]
MFDQEDLRRMSPQERQQLRQALADLDRPDPAAKRASERRRAVLLAAVIVCCVLLAAWIGVLAVTLPRYYRAGGWRAAWVGFDVGLLLAFAATGWSAWRRRQLLVVCLVVLATLLCCDAWFDVVLDARTSGFALSLASALVIELPLAAIAMLAARRLLRTTSAVLQRYRGEGGTVPRLRDIALVGVAPGRPLTDLMARPEDQCAVPAGGPGAARAGED